jgi:hypothetical protein
VEGTGEHSRSIKCSFQHRPGLAVSADRVISEAVGATFGRGLVAKEGGEDQVHADEMVHQLMDRPVCARGRSRPLLLSNARDQVTDGREGAGELVNGWYSGRSQDIRSPSWTVVTIEIMPP